MIDRIHRVALIVIAAAGGCLLLCSCEGTIDFGAKMDSIGVLPLWQKVAAIAAASLISEDLACITAGMLASENILSYEWALAASIIGIYLGDVFLYVLGRIGGIGLLRRIPFRWWISEERILQAENLFEEHGAKLIFSSRLLPGSRLPVYAAAGVLNYPAWRFLLFMFLAGSLSAVILVTLAYQLGEVVLDWLRVYEAYAIPVFAIGVALIWIGVKIFEIMATKRSRLVFLARIRRFLQLSRARKGQKR